MNYNYHKVIDVLCVSVWVITIGIWVYNKIR